jgi:hypothetical protein
MEWLDAHRAALRALIERIYVGDRNLTERDIRLRQIDAEIATLYLHELSRVLAEGIDQHEFCRSLGRGQSYQRMRLRIRLERDWERYVQLRRAAGNSGRYGLDFAIELLNGEADKAEPIEISTDSRTQEAGSQPKRYKGSPPLLLRFVEAKIGPFNDLCPYPLLWLPVTNWINILLRAGAEAIPLGRVGYIDVDSGEPHPQPGASALFVLRDKKRRQRDEQDGVANQLLAELRGW